jgi:hypothetical protein
MKSISSRHDQYVNQTTLVRQTALAYIKPALFRIF